MRLKRVWLDNFKNLKNLEVRIDPAQAVNVVVGQNGTGKSNLLEALVVIFRDLDLNPARPSLRYELDYEINGHNVAIDADPDRPRGRLKFTVDGRLSTLKELEATKAELLPGFIFGYYSGPSARFRGHFDAHQNRYYQRLLDEDEALPLRTLFLAESFHSQFVLLAFLLEPDDVINAFLKQHLRIESLSSVEFVLHQPDWATRTTKDAFWGARGAPRRLMEVLFDESIAPIREPAQDRVNFRQTVNREHLWLYLDGLESIERVYRAYESRQEFFKAMESLVISELLHELRVVVRVRNVEDGQLDFRELSEGEQQLLIVLGLLRFTQAANSLLLLDEPDTHLNPGWSVRYTEFLGSVMGELPTSQVLMATHDPLVIASLVREQVLLLERGEDGEVHATMPERDPRGMGVAGLLTSEIYGLRSQLDPYTLERLEEKRRLASLPERTSEQDARLRELGDLVDDVDMAATVRDPLYREFVGAMSDLEHGAASAPVVLTREEMAAREELVREVAAELREAEPGP